MVDTVIFDLDGTLLDTLDDLTGSVNFMLRSLGLAPKEREEIRALVGEGLIALIEHVLPEGSDKKVVKQALAVYREHYAKNQFNQTKPYDGIIELLFRLKEEQFKTAVVSNKADKAVKELVNFYFKDLIHVAVGDNFVRPVKPDPASLKFAMAKLDSVPARCVMVGDSEPDIRAAHNCGIRAIGVTWGFRDRSVLIRERAECVIDTPQQLWHKLAGD